MSKEPETLIESSGYIYKLMVSKEEQLKIDKEKQEKLERNFKAFKSKLGGDLYNYLAKDKAVISYRSGGHYSSTTYFDFGDNTTWSEYEYDSSPKEHFGDTDWYNYDGSMMSNFATAPVYEAACEYLLNKLKV